MEKKRRLFRLPSHPLPRETLILLAFFLLTVLMTWPWVTRLRDAVANVGDPYMIAWALWWDYHQTFNDPLNLFHANVFYPHRYTLAFSEHDYGIAVLFFPLFALGLRPLTVHSVATFCGFAFCGYSAFRLARTLTGSSPAGVVAGVFFAFVPYRFNLLEHLHYLFAGWLPLMLEALVLFARGPTRRRAAWLGVSLVMNALTCVTWMVLSLAPLSLSLVYLVARYRLTKEGAFWVRGGAAVALSALVALPFLLPYRYASELYGFGWSREEVLKNSTGAAAWLVAEGRNKLWRGLGASFGIYHPLFPGLVAPLLALAALVSDGGRKTSTRARDVGDAARPEHESPAVLRPSKLHPAELRPRLRFGLDLRGRLQLSPRVRQQVVSSLDALAVVAGVLALVAAGYARAGGWAGRVFGVVTADRALLLLALAVVARLSVAYPHALRRAEGRNLRETIRASRRGDAFWLGALWAAAGFLMSLGMNSLFYRLVYEHVFLFRSQRVPARAAMLAYVGLAVLAGLGASRVAEAWERRRLAPSDGRRFRRAWVVYALLACALMFELRAAPLAFVRGAVAADGVTRRLKATPMRGGLVELPAGLEGPNHLYMLRAADHARPLVNATSSFVPKTARDIYEYTRAGPIDARLLDLFEEIPVSYVVMRNALVADERRADYESFLARAVESGRLRFVRRFDERDDLYAVTKTEPGARQEMPTPAPASVSDWDALLAEDPVHLLGRYAGWSLRVYRLHAAASGRMPRMTEFVRDVRSLGRGVLVGRDDQSARLEENLGALAGEFVARPPLAGLTDEQFVARVYANAGVGLARDARVSLVASLGAGAETRASVLLKLTDEPEFVRREQTRSLVLLHYFAYLRRNPDEPPDDGLAGFNFWVAEVEASGDTSRLTRAFMASGERGDKKSK